VRLNESHPSPAKPSWYGDSVGHCEGDTLVIDTVAVKSQVCHDRPVRHVLKRQVAHRRALSVARLRGREGRTGKEQERELAA
jgi:hypothetical protein